MFNKKLDFKGEEFKELVHSLENEAKKQVKDEVENLQQIIINTRKINTELENKNIELQQQNEILNCKINQIIKSASKPKNKIDKETGEIINLTNELLD